MTRFLVKLDSVVKPCDGGGGVASRSALENHGSAGNFVDEGLYGARREARRRQGI